MQNENETEKFSVSRARKIGFFYFIFRSIIARSAQKPERKICKANSARPRHTIEARNAFLVRTPPELFRLLFFLLSAADF